MKPHQMSKLVLCALVLCCLWLVSGCATDTNYSQTVPDATFGLAPLARKNAPINTDPVGSYNKLRGMGTLLDLMK